MFQPRFLERSEKIEDNDAVYAYDEAIEEAIKLFGSDAVVRTNTRIYSQIIEHSYHVSPDRRSQKVIVEEAPVVGTYTVNEETLNQEHRFGLSWILRPVHEDGTIGWNEAPLATIFRNRDYQAIVRQ